MSEPERWYKPKLIEVSIPLEDINKESAREKSIRHGHPSTLHLWWARRPLAACRAVLFAQLVDDPSAHPDRFQTEEAQQAERERLHRIIKRLVVWENIHDEALLKEAREEIWKSCDGNPPPILDPFAGGGSIPLEAQRLGLEAHASDLNPVAVLINKALIEIPPKFSGQPPVFPGAAASRLSWPGATGLAEDVRSYAKWIRDEAEKRLGQYYPTTRLADGTDALVVAWLWARTVTCPNPACRATVPLISTFWLATNKTRPTWLRPVVDGKRVTFEIVIDKTGPTDPPKRGRGAKFACLVCAVVTTDSYVKAEGRAQRIGTQLLAIVAEGKNRRIYVPATEEHVHAADVPRPASAPDASMPDNPRWFSPPAYGMACYADLFTNRQLMALTTFTELIAEARTLVAEDARAKGLSEQVTASYSDAVATYLAFAISKLADRGSSICSWVVQRESNRNTFARQAIPMTWDFVEMNPLLSGTGSFAGAAAWTIESLESVPAQGSAVVVQADATTLSNANPVVLATDPPYYDNIGYADLSDFFYVWLRTTLATSYPDLFATMLTPKAQELIATPYRFGGNRSDAENFFEDRFREFFSNIRDSHQPHFPTTVIYAFKQSEEDTHGIASTGWEKMLSALLDADLCVTATWPLQTERATRSVDIGTNALASSIVLACRPRPSDAAVTDRRGLIAALREDLPGALRKLQEGGVAPVDLPQAAIGPGMAVFSRYVRVNEPDGSAMRVRPALSLINQVLDEVLSQQEGDFGPDTRWCLEWFKSYGFESGSFGVAETLSKAKNTSVAGLERAGVLKSGGGKVRLLAIGDLPADYDPSQDERVSEWEIVLHLAKRLREQGADAAAQLMAAGRAVIDIDAVRELAYLLFSVAEKHGWAEIALLFNGLGTSWSDLAEASRKQSAADAHVQGQLGFDADEG